MTNIAITTETYYLVYAGSIKAFTIRRTAKGGVSSDSPHGSRFSNEAISRFCKTPAEAKAEEIEYMKKRIERLDSELTRERVRLEKLINLPVS